MAGVGSPRCSPDRPSLSYTWGLGLTPSGNKSVGGEGARAVETLNLAGFHWV